MLKKKRISLQDLHNSVNETHYKAAFILWSADANAGGQTSKFSRQRKSIIVVLHAFLIWDVVIHACMCFK